MAAFGAIPAGGGVWSRPAPSPGRKGFRFRQWREQPRSGPCGWRPSRVSPPPPPPYCLCEERGARPLALPLPPQVQWEPPGEAVEGWRLARNRAAGRGRPLCFQRTPECPSPSPAPPPLYTHTGRGACNPPGRPGATPQPGAGGGGRDVGAEAGVKVGASFRESSSFGERGLH